MSIIIKNPKIIAEIGCNHKGDFEIAKEMIKIAAKFCEVDVVKFQKRNPIELLSNEEYNNPHPDPSQSYGLTYGAHREFLELNIDQHSELKKFAELNEVKYLCSVWDLTSTKQIISIEPEMIKIPSAINLNFEVLEYICNNFDGDIHLSLGMTSNTEIDEIINFFDNNNKSKSLILYHCTSAYPVKFENVYLLDILKINQKFKNKIKSVGFSGHHLGIAADIAALTLGTEWFERHFTLDRTWKGTDHAASLEPDGMRRLTRDLKNVRKTLEYKPDEFPDCEQIQRKKLKRIKRPSKKNE